MSESSGERAGRRWPAVAAVAALLAGAALTAGPAAESAGRSRLEARRPSDAARWFARAVALGAGDDVRLLLARARRQAGDAGGFAEALKTAEQAGVSTEAIARERLLAAAHAGRLDGVEDRLDDLLITAGDDGRVVVEAFANGYIANYRLDEATRLLDLWAEAFPDDPQERLVRGRLLEHKGEWDAAAALYREAADAGHGPAAYNLGRLLLNRNDPAAAGEAYRGAARWLDDDAPAAVGLAHCLRTQGRRAEARAVIEPVVARGGGSPAAFAQVGLPPAAAASAALAELAQLETAVGNHAEAADLLTRAVERSPKDQTLHYLLGRSLAASGRSDEASEHLAYFERASEATERLDKLMERLRADPSDAGVRAEIGGVFLEHLSESQGRTWLRSALRIDPGNAVAHRLLADYYARDPQTAAAAERHRRLAGGGDANAG